MNVYIYSLRLDPVWLNVEMGSEWESNKQEVIELMYEQESTKCLNLAFSNITQMAADKKVRVESGGCGTSR